MIKEVKSLIQKVLNSLEKEGVLIVGKDIKIVVETPGNQDYGDYSTNIALVLAKKNKISPQKIADLIISKISSDYFKKIEVVGGFINFTLSQKVLIDNIQEILEKRENYGREKLIGKTIVIDYSSPNIAKAFGIGHLRSTIIGQAIYNIYQFLGWKCIGDNHLGDWGTQFGKLTVAIKKWNEKDLEKLSVNDLEALYVKFHKEAEKDDSLLDEGREWFKKLEDGDKEAKKIWKICVRVSLKEFDKIYDILGIKIDNTLGESFYEDKMASVIEDAKNRGVVEKSLGALVIPLPETKVPLMLLKSDGATTYGTRDLATIRYRIDRWQPDLIVYEVGVDQKFHFKQLFQAAEILGYGRKEQFIHIAHGMFRWKDGKFSTRRGKTIHLGEVLIKGIDLAKKIIKDRKISEREKERIAKIIGIGAIKYNDLSQHHTKDIIFDWDKILNLQGNSAPYIQYMIVRCYSILEKNSVKLKNERKYKDIFSENKIIELSDMEYSERVLLRNLFKYKEIVNEAALNFSPNIIANYIYKLAQDYSVFYENCPILIEKNQKKRELRLALTDATKEILKSGLLLLGIETVKEM